MHRIFRLRISSFQIITGSFLGVILLGALILMLPISSVERVVTPFGDALFTSTSAVCVTGLVVHDTFRYWSAFGKCIILFLIQIGGLGTITLSVLATVLAGRKVSLFQRSIMKDAVSADEIGSIVPFTLFILTGTLAVELLGVFFLFPIFFRELPLAQSILYAVFHSISAFCNAGFDLMGKSQPYSSLTGYTGSILMNVTIMTLIVVGGLGFRTWEDILNNKRNIHKYRLQTKLILSTTLVLILLPAVIFFFVEYRGVPIKERILASLFQSVTTRTAGFNTTDYAAFTDSGKFLSIVLMMIGGSPGSTAGGMKTTTLAVLLANAASVFRQKKETVMFGRRIDDSVIKSASALMIIYFFLTIGCGILISVVEGLPMKECLFETASAVGTVGLTLGITPSLGLFSHMILILLMFFGRVGGLTLMYAALSGMKPDVSRRPVEKINVG